MLECRISSAENKTNTSFSSHSSSHSSAFVVGCGTKVTIVAEKPLVSLETFSPMIQNVLSAAHMSNFFIRYASVADCNATLMAYNAKVVLGSIQKMAISTITVISRLFTLYKPFGSTFYKTHDGKKYSIRSR